MAEYNEIISWSKNGKSVQIKDKAQFVEVILPILRSGKYGI
jgi:hypothetical protein